MKNKGITLIALVITIVVLIILAGVAINLTLGENGVFKKASKAKQQYEIATAKEIIELKITELQAEKEGKATLEELVEYLKDDSEINYTVSLTELTASLSNDITVGDASEIYVVYKVYQFKVNKKLETKFISIVENIELPKEENSDIATLPEGTDTSKPIELTTNIAIKTNTSNTLGLTGIENITYNMVSKTDNISLTNGKIIANKNANTVDKCVLEVTGTYNGVSYKNTITAYVEPKEIVSFDYTDLNSDGTETQQTTTGYAIYDEKDFSRFRDLINANVGSSQNAKLMNDIDLSSICSQSIGSWSPILDYSGIFNGDYHKINNLYINSDSYKNIGMFNQITSTANIQNLIMDNIYVYNSYKQSESITGGIVGVSSGFIKNCGINSGSVAGYDMYTTFSGSFTGGIAGVSNTIRASYNKATITMTTYTGNNMQGSAGGITGKINKETLNCYNTGNIATKAALGYVGGIVGQTYRTSSTYVLLKNCYNYGIISGNHRIGGVLGQSGWSSTYYAIDVVNSYCTTDSTTYSYYYWNGSGQSKSTANRVSASTLKASASSLGDAYVPDGKKYENGELIDNRDNGGNIIYTNNGYPILKWEMKELR